MAKKNDECFSKSVLSLEFRLSIDLRIDCIIRAV
jgi:hypothetical protein